MLKLDRFRGPFGCILATFSLIGCGGGTNQPDPFHGVVSFQDLSNPQIDSKFLSQSCTASPSGPACRSANSVSQNYACANYVYNCYNVQEGHAKGQPFYFYNFLSLTAGISPVQICDPTPNHSCSGGTVRSNISIAAIEPTPVGGGGAHVDVFPNECAPGAVYNEQLDNYATSSQYPIFNNLPIALTSNQVLDGDFDYPIGATYGVTLSATETCNDLKDARSIGDSGSTGSYGATRTALPTGYRLMGPVDISVSTVPVYASNGLLISSPPFQPIPGDTTGYGPLYGWYEGLLTRYLDGGPIPTTTATDTLTGATYTAFAAMDGVILDPTATTSLADPADQNAILLPYTPGDASYSPIVRLHDYHVPSGVSAASLTSICQASDPHPCPATSVDYTKVTSAPKWMIFIAAPAQ